MWLERSGSHQVLVSCGSASLFHYFTSICTSINDTNDCDSAAALISPFTLKTLLPLPDVTPVQSTGKPVHKLAISVKMNWVRINLILLTHLLLSDELRND